MEKNNIQQLTFWNQTRGNELNLCKRFTQHERFNYVKLNTSGIHYDIQHNQTIIPQAKNSSHNMNPQVNHHNNRLLKPNIDITITSNVPIMISPLGLTYISEKQITLK